MVGQEHHGRGGGAQHRALGVTDGAGKCLGNVDLAAPQAAVLHAQVRHQRIAAVQHQPHELAAAADAGERAALQPPREISSSSYMAADRSGIQHLNVRHGPARHPAVQPAPDNLEVPPHMYLSDTKLLIGEDKKA